MKKTNAIRILESKKIPYYEREYEIEDGKNDALSVVKKLGQQEGQVFKTLVTHSNHNENFVFVVPANCELDLKKAAVVSGQKSIEMLPLVKLLPVTGYVHGGCSPIGMKKQFKTYIDLSAKTYASIFISGGKVGVQIELNPEDLAKLIQAEFVDLVKK